MTYNALMNRTALQSVRGAPIVTGGSKAIYPAGIDARDLSLGDAH